MLTVAGMASAQSLQGILQSIEANNTRLAALRSNNNATMAQLDSETSIVGPTSVEYSPFFGGGASGLASSELIVSQEFEFPSLSGMRKQSNAAQGRVLDLQYQQERRDILVEAKKLCYDITARVEARNVLKMREHTSDSLLTAYETSMKHGNATIIDVNRIKMDRMAVHTQVVQNEGEIATLLAQLQTLNGGKPIEGGENLICEKEKVADNAGTSLEETIAQASFNATAHEVKLAQKAWLPSLTVGYRRNTELKEATNGFLVGVSMPLFNNSSKVKAAKARQQAVQAQIDDAISQERSRQQALVAEVKQLEASIKAYDMPLMMQTLAYIKKAIGAGALTIPEYYNQADRIYDTILQFIDLQNKYNRAACDLNRNML